MCSRGHERLANSAPTISGVVEKTTARRNPSRCKIRSRRSSKLTPHNSINASGAFAIKTGSTLSIARKFNGGCAALLAAACRSHEPLFSRYPYGLWSDIRSCNLARNNTDSALATPKYFGPTRRHKFGMEPAQLVVCSEEGKSGRVPALAITQ